MAEKTSSHPSLDKGIQVISGYVKKLTSSPGVYRMLNGNGDVLYVGKAKNLKKRVSSYTRPQKQPIRIQRMVSMTEKMVFVTTHTEAESLLLEANLIKSLKPRYNILFKDDKSFPYILLTKGDLPSRLVFHRGAKTAKGTYFGPYASRHAVWKTLDTLSRIFKLRTCTDAVFKNRSRPCLQYYIKRCSGPCVGRVTDAEYQEQVAQAHQFLSGKTQVLQKDLAQKMQKASQGRQYELAAELRDQIEALTRTQETQGVHVRNVNNADVVATQRVQDKVAVQIFFFRNGANHGSRTFFPKHSPDDSEADVLEAFLSWFYADQEPPPYILVNHKLDDQEILSEMLAQNVRHGVTIRVPQKGVLAQLVRDAEKNAGEALALKLSDRVSTEKLLEGVAAVFGLVAAPQRIEVYDNSHNLGKEAYGAMIVATPEGFDKKSYRKFGIKDVTPHQDGGNDYAMMQEVLTRRFKKMEDSNR